MADESTRQHAPLRTLDLGRLDYPAALQRQRQVHAAVLNGEADETLILVEHEPVITLGKRPGADKHLVASRAMLEQQGVALCVTDRGGDITYHGPGQMVAYPIVRLNDRGMNLRQYVWRLEQAIIDTLDHFGLAAERDRCAVGVWTPPADDAPAAKLAAIGVRASRWVTMHGLALNVATNLDHFKLIVPCGLAGRPVTSMRERLGDACPTLDVVKTALTERLLAQLHGSAPLPEQLTRRG